LDPNSAPGNKPHGFALNPAAPSYALPTRHEYFPAAAMATIVSIIRHLQVHCLRRTLGDQAETGNTRISGRICPTLVHHNEFLGLNKRGRKAGRGFGQELLIWDAFGHEMLTFLTQQILARTMGVFTVRNQSIFGVIYVLKLNSNNDKNQITVTSPRGQNHAYSARVKRDV